MEISSKILEKSLSYLESLLLVEKDNEKLLKTIQKKIDQTMVSDIKAQLNTLSLIRNMKNDAIDSSFFLTTFTNLSRGSNYFAEERNRILSELDVMFEFSVKNSVLSKIDEWNPFLSNRYKNYLENLTQALYCESMFKVAEFGKLMCMDLHDSGYNYDTLNYSLFSICDTNLWYHTETPSLTFREPDSREEPNLFLPSKGYIDKDMRLFYYLAISKNIVPNNYLEETLGANLGENMMFSNNAKELENVNSRYSDILDNKRLLSYSDDQLLSFAKIWSLVIKGDLVWAIAKKCNSITNSLLAFHSKTGTIKELSDFA